MNELAASSLRKPRCPRKLRGWRPFGEFERLFCFGSPLWANRIKTKGNCKHQTIIRATRREFTHFCLSLKDTLERKYFDLASQAGWPKKATKIGNRGLILCLHFLLAALEEILSVHSNGNSWLIIALQAYRRFPHSYALQSSHLFSMFSC